MKNIIRTVVAALSLLTVNAASATTLKIEGPTVTADFAKDALPPCDRATMAIFNAAEFDGWIYLHDTDIKLDAMQVKAIKALAQDGQLPAVCQVNSIPFVTVASR